MIGFKEILQQDLQNVFFNQEEFGETHTWNKRKIKAIVDDDALMEKYDSEFQFLGKGSHLVMAPESEFETIPSTNTGVVFDGKLYTLDEVQKESGLLVFFLDTNGR